MTQRKPYVMVLYNHVGEDEYEKLKTVDPKSLDFKPAYDIQVPTVLDEYKALAEGLRVAGYRTRAVNIRDDLKRLQTALRRSKPDAVFNVIEHFHDDPELEAHVAGLFELHGVPYTGSPPFVLTLCQRKGLAKQVLAARGVPTPRFRILESEDTSRRHRLRYPLIVKPAWEDASSGIDRQAVVHDAKALHARLDYVFGEFSSPVLVEEFIVGTELHVGVLGNDPPEILPPIEWDFSDLPEGHPAIISFAAKWNPLDEVFHRIHSRCPARLPEPVLARVQDVALRAYEALGARDYARLDIRLDADNNPFVLEVNPNPDLTEGVSFMEAAEVAGYEFDETLGMIAEWAIERKPTPEERKHTPEKILGTALPPSAGGMEPLSPPQPDTEAQRDATGTSESSTL
ncbi:MAG: D-alanine--D-alanine ligase family protein [Planctomycetota bacterium]|jgi:D-alanine-D-alanine ligase